ncbi:hypothetical protein [Aliiruegeria lutimaris]|uniref:DUF2946 domain-containing protein n=1 Tax=Aliiruegeria lutimaris TaxID=571298 RepID=A0A1G8YUL0_9RHOB|nr:hypothetical protein [Aliiruegeria lutimaris]SDK06529.1 hypothetical protein SAMN04488026_103025 [Aliiruegeria lutimaris]
MIRNRLHALLPLYDEKPTQVTRKIERPRSRPTGNTLLRVLALVTMVFQVLLTADHLGASAARSLGVAPPGTGLGIMEICSGDGVALVDLGGDGQDCPVCASAAVADFGDSSNATAPDFAIVALALTMQIPRRDDMPARRSMRAASIRAPPVLPV